MHAIEVLEIADERTDALPGVVGFEHVVAHELGQVADRLHRHRLIEEIKCLCVRDPQITAEAPAVLFEAFEQPNAVVRTQALTQLLDVVSEIGKIGCDAERARCNDVEARRVALAGLQPENLGERHFPLCSAVRKYREQHAIALFAAQRLRLRCAR